MKKEFVPYELALELKELGFDEPCFGYYVDGELRGINLGMEELGGVEPYYQRFGFHTLSNHDIDNPNKIVVTAPTYSQAFRWFREKHQIVFCYEPCLKKDLTYIFFIYVEVTGEKVFVVESKYNEEAELTCLQKMIEIVKTK
jgi:hypothetical protein